MNNLLEMVGGELAKKKKKQEAVAANALAQLMRPGQAKIRCSARVVESYPIDVASEKSNGPQKADFRVVLITEGMGNSVDKHFYGREAIESAPSVFEGRPCFIDHPSESEDKDIPERRVASKCGYFRNVHVESVGGVPGLVGELVLDWSDTGREARAKLITALRYKSEFPNLESEYVGLSINASGEFEKRTMTVEGQKVDVKYVTRFTRAVSCDIVTEPARGGRVLALVESAAGAKRRQEGASMKKVMQMFEAARKALKGSLTESDPVKAKEKMVEADTMLESAVQEASATVEADEAAAIEAKAKADADTAAAAEAAKKAKKEADDAAAAADDGDDDTKESRKLAVKAMLAEAKVPATDDVVAQLDGVSLKEAKKKIDFLKSFQESTVRKTLRTMGTPAAQFEKLNESDRKEAGSSHNDKFARCNR